MKRKNTKYEMTRMKWNKQFNGIELIDRGYCVYIIIFEIDKMMASTNDWRSEIMIKKEQQQQHTVRKK